MDALMEELLGSGSTGKATSPSAARMENVFTSAVAEPAIEALMQTLEQASPSERTILMATLAPTLADALAPALARALVPYLNSALMTALSELAKSAGQHGHKSGSHEDDERHEGD
jgi:hypothetical protein